MVVMPASRRSEQDLANLLVDLGRKVRDHVIFHRELSSDSQVVGNEGGDVIFALDRKVESVVMSALDGWPAELKPLTLVAEGFGIDGRKYFGDRDSEQRYRLLVDPIDGTRELMYEKRSGWFLA